MGCAALDSFFRSLLRACTLSWTSWCDYAPLYNTQWIVFFQEFPVTSSHASHCWQIITYDVLPVVCTFKSDILLTFVQTKHLLQRNTPPCVTEIWAFLGFAFMAVMAFFGFAFMAVTAFFGFAFMVFLVFMSFFLMAMASDQAYEDWWLGLGLGQWCGKTFSEDVNQHIVSPASNVPSDSQ